MRALARDGSAWQLCCLHESTFGAKRTSRGIGPQSNAIAISQGDDRAPTQSSSTFAAFLTRPLVGRMGPTYRVLRFFLYSAPPTYAGAIAPARCSFSSR
jgi:hypothetical protein